MNYISISEYLKTNSLSESLQVWSMNSKLKKYWKLGSIKSGYVKSGNIRLELDPENMFVKV